MGCTHTLDRAHGTSLRIDLDQSGVLLDQVDKEHTDAELLLWGPDLCVAHAHGIRTLLLEPTTHPLVCLQLVLGGTGQHGLKPEPFGQGVGQGLELGGLGQLVDDHTHGNSCDLVWCKLQQRAHVGVATASPTITHGVAVLTQIIDDPVHTHGSKHVAMSGQGFHALLTALVHPGCECVGTDLQHLTFECKLAIKLGHAPSLHKMLALQDRTRPDLRRVSIGTS